MFSNCNFRKITTLVQKYNIKCSLSVKVYDNIIAMALYCHTVCYTLFHSIVVTEAIFHIYFHVLYVYLFKAKR